MPTVMSKQAAAAVAKLGTMRNLDSLPGGSRPRTLCKLQLWSRCSIGADCSKSGNEQEEAAAHGSG